MVDQRELDGHVRVVPVVLRGDLLELECAALLEHAPVVRPEAVCQVRGEHVVVGLPDEVLALHVEELFEPAVDKHVAALAVLQPDHRGAVVEDRVELRLAAAHPVVSHRSRVEKLPSRPPSTV